MRLCRRAAIWTDRKLSDGFTAVTTVVNTPAEAVVVLLGCRCKLSLGAGKISVDGSLKLSLGACGAQRCIRRRTMLRSFLVHNRSSSTPGQASLLVAVDEDRIWHSPASAYLQQCRCCRMRDSRCSCLELKHATTASVMISCALAGIHRSNRGWNSRSSAATAARSSECYTLVVVERKRNSSLQAVG